MNTKHIVLLNTFTRIATLIFIFSSLYIFIFWGPDTEVPISYVWGVVFIAVVSSVLRIPFLTDKEMPKMQMLLFNIAYFLCVNGMVLVVGYYLGWFDPDNSKMIAGLEFTIMVVYTCVMVVTYQFDSCIAKKMSEKLKKLSSENK